MTHVITLQDFIQDDFVPKPKEPPARPVEDVTLDYDEENCPLCNEPLEYWYLSTERTLIATKGDVNLQVVHKCCVNEECPACQQGRNFYNPVLDAYALPHRHLALDVTLLIGYLIFHDHKTEDGVVTYLWEQHGIRVTQPCVHSYKNLCLALGQALLVASSDKVQVALAKTPARVYTVDGVASNKSETLFIVRELTSGLTLGVALLDAHDADTIHAFLEQVFEAFGIPDFLVGDGQSGLISAARTYYPNIDYEYCHRHFLTNLGKALMCGDYESLKKNSAARKSSRRSAS